MIGRALTKAIEADGEAVFASTRRSDRAGGRRPFVDLDTAVWEDVLTERFSVAYLCAAMARLDACHADPERAMSVNAINMAGLAEALMARGTHVILLSTNQVFDGTLPHPRPDTPPSPVTAYGRSKAAAEGRITALKPHADHPHPAVLRLSKVVEPGMPLLANWAHQLANGVAVEAARDMTLAPLPVTQVVMALRTMAARSTAGIVQLAAKAEITYVDAARHVAERVGAPTERVIPVDSVAAGFLKEAPPRHTILDGVRAFRELGIAPEDPFHTLDGALSAFRA